MSRQRLVTLVVAALVVLASGLYLSSQRSAQHETQGVELYPGLAGELNSVTAVTVQKGGATAPVTIHKTGDRWTVAERGDYPADVSKLRKLLSALSETKIVEQKTSDPARYATIGVEDLSQPGSAGIEVTVIEPAKKLSVIVGKAVGEGSFVRRAGEKSSYSIEPALSLETEPRYWIDSRLIDIPAAQIQSVEFKPAAGPGYTLRRPKPEDNTFSLDGVPTGRKALDGALAPAATTFAGLTAEDVAPVSDVDFTQSSAAIVTLADGGILTLTGAAIADKHWVQVKSSKDSVLSAKAQGRAFQIASYRYDAIFKPLEQLLAPKETPGALKPGARQPGALMPASPHTPQRPRPAATAP
jgi:hypothetical protein